MSRQQTIVWTALPNGVVDNGAAPRLRLSAFASIRLWTDEGAPKPTLGLFPDFLDWPSQALDFTVQFGNGRPVTATRVGPDPRSDLWTALFHSDTFVRPAGASGGSSQSRFAGRVNTPILSYPVRNIQAFLRNQYAKFAVSSPEDYPAATTLLDADGLQPIATQEAHGYEPVSGLREAILNPQLASTLAQHGAVPASPPAASWDFFLLKKFHEPLTKNRGTAPKAPVLDFHQILSLLGEYPILLRRLGLVHDLEVPVVWPAPPGNTTVQVFAHWTPSEPNTVNVPNADRAHRTRCRASVGEFSAASRQSAPEITPEGTLRFDDSSAYEVVQVDADGAAIKLMDLANNLVRSQFLKKTDSTPTAYSLPSLRSAGLSVAKANHAKGMHESFIRSAQLNLQLESAPSPQDETILDREDLTRGFAIDVWDSASGVWRSLCERVGTYRFLDLGDGGTFSGERDEGWVSVALTTSADGSAPHAKLHESVARWWGWSLSAPRPGMTAGADGRPEAPANDPAPEFRLKVDFRPPAGSLPRLRFGTTYRLRARAVDLAGNRTERQDPSLDEFRGASSEATYGRFEPVVAPTVVFRRPRTAGESVERLVIRSNYDTPIEAEAERHLAPPKADKDLIEAHGRLDRPSAQGGGLDQNAYSLLARPIAPDSQWEGGSIADIRTPDANNAGLPYVDQDKLPLPYLPDPLALGALLRGLPGKPEPLSVWYSGGWPRLAPYRLIVREGSDAPVVDASAQAIIVSLPKAGVAGVRLSSLLGHQDPNLLGLLAWVQQEKPAEVGAFLDKVARGTHWMVTPYRTLTLVHAVRQPLLAPAFTRFTAQKLLGDTFATLVDDAFVVSQKSTVHVDVNAGWVEWLDPLDEPRDVQLPVQARAFQQAVTPGSPKNPVDSMILTGQHKFGDTKYRQVTYTASATTRFSEYYKETKRGVLLAAGSPIALDAKGVVPGTDSVRASDGSGSFARDEDYTIDYAAGTLTPSIGLNGRTVDIGYIAPPISRDTADAANTIEPARRRVLDILNSARPAAPKVLYVLPTFGWSSTAQVGGRSFTSTRSGRGLRVYLDRPWWSSGAGELLGVVLWGGGGGLAPDNLKPYVTQWGADPIFQTPKLPTLPGLDHFELATVKDDSSTTQLSLDEVANAPIQVAGHEVGYDEERRLWFCDISVHLPVAYYPLIRLALARYQPHSVTDAHLSRVTLADFAQLAPDRTVSITRDASVNPPKYNITVSGIGYQVITNTAGPSQMEASWEERNDGVGAAAEDLAWAPVAHPAPIVLTPQVPAPISLGGAYQWTGTITRPTSNNPLRLVIKEFEVYNGAASAPQRRLVYADTIHISSQGAQ